MPGCPEPGELCFDFLMVLCGDRVASAQGFESRAVCAVLCLKANCIQLPLKPLILLLQEVLRPLIRVHHGEALFALRLTFPKLVLLLGLFNRRQPPFCFFSPALGLCGDPRSRGYAIRRPRPGTGYFST